MSLIQKIRASRESTVEVGGAKFIIRRPTEAEQSEYFGDQAVSSLEVIRRCVCGWNLQEIDVVPGGNPVPLEFSQELWAEYVDDHRELWQPIFDAIIDSIVADRKKREDAAKK